MLISEQKKGKKSKCEWVVNCKGFTRTFHGTRTKFDGAVAELKQEQGECIKK